jgi:hypothetical protein
VLAARIAMDLSPVEKQLIHFIDDKFPIAWEPLSAKEIMTYDEKPLVSDSDLSAAFSMISPEEMAAALKRLLAFQCIN